MTTGGERPIKKAPARILAVLTLAALAAVLLTWNWGNYRERLRALRTASARAGRAVDTRSLDAAEQLAQLAETRAEKAFAEDALRLADYSVDYAFAAALQDAIDRPTPLTPATREISARLDSSAAAVAADEHQLAELTRRGSGGSIAQQQQLDVVNAQLELDRDALDDARQDMVRAGGDRQALIKRLRDQHEASHSAGATGVTGAAGTAGTGGAAGTARANGTTTAPAVAPAGAPSVELTKSSSMVVLAEAWFSLHAKQTLLLQAQQNARDREERLTAAHDSIEKLAADLKAQKGASADLKQLNALTAYEKKVTALDHRIGNEGDLATVYANWLTFVSLREQALVHGMFLDAFWIFFIALLLYALSATVNHLFASIAADRRELHTFRTAVLFGVQATGVALILILLFGAPGNIGTVLAVVGAGLTVALQDFIIGFIGWFVLMGKDGMRPGDWVEINGVAGEVLQVGVFKTVLLETGNWAESVSPTGRKVTFVNSFAIQGHYFNFSTSGQWLWDELHVQVAPGVDPYEVADAIQRIAAKEIAANAGAAEQEWRRVVKSYATNTFSAQPSATVRPSGPGVSVVLRYLSKASERQETRARLYRALIELSQGKQPTSTVTPT